MKTRLIWKDCELFSLNDENSDESSKQDAFWVECTDEEVASQIAPLVLSKKSKPVNGKVEHFCRMVFENRGTCEFNENPKEMDLCNYFLVSRDLKYIMTYPGNLPYMSGWESSNPFMEFEPVNLEEINSIGTLLSPELAEA